MRSEAATSHRFYAGEQMFPSANSATLCATCPPLCGEKCDLIGVSARAGGNGEHGVVSVAPNNANLAFAKGKIARARRNGVSDCSGSTAASTRLATTGGSPSAVKLHCRDPGLRAPAPCSAIGRAAWLWGLPAVPAGYRSHDRRRPAPSRADQALHRAESMARRLGVTATQTLALPDSDVDPRGVVAAQRREPCGRLAPEHRPARTTAAGRRHRPPAQRRRPDRDRVDRARSRPRS